MAAHTNITLMPFLYPCLLGSSRPASRCALGRSFSNLRSQPRCDQGAPFRVAATSRRQASTRIDEANLPELPAIHPIANPDPSSSPSQSPSPSGNATSTHLNPSPADFSSTPFTDSCTLTVHAGSGGHGCVSFLREKFIAEGPANGGDGGTGGNVWIQAVGEERSLHKLARRGVVRAGRGGNGMGKSRGGARGEDVLITVPVGTVVTEISRWDPVAKAEDEWEEVDREEMAAGRGIRKRGRAKLKANRLLGGTLRGFGADAEYDDPEGAEGDEIGPGNSMGARQAIPGDQRGKWRRDRWLLQPSSLPSEYATTAFPALPRPRRSNLSAQQPQEPILMDLETPSERPLLLAAGAVGGLGNPHFATKTITRPKFATKGDSGMQVRLQLELKLLADLGLVGMPNAGKSTLLRSLTNSRARVGSWAFTTLAPNIGTVVLDDHKGRLSRFDATSASSSGSSNQARRTAITVADIPGLIQGASDDRGLGLGFLRHVERAKALAFVVDLGAGDAIESLRGLWKELDAYEALRERADHEASQKQLVDWEALGDPLTGESGSGEVASLVAFDENGEAVLGDGGGSSSSGHQQQADLPDMWHHSAGIALKPLAVKMQPISGKPWFVVATKADLPDTQDNFRLLQEYLGRVTAGELPHPAQGSTRRRHMWNGELKAIPVSAINGHGMDRIVQHTSELLSGVVTW